MITAARRPTRRADDRVVAGVAGGLGDALGVEPNVVRCGFLVLALADGLGVLLYALGCWLLPARSGQEKPRQQQSDKLRNRGTKTSPIEKENYNGSIERHENPWKSEGGFCR